jgi:hypothetical protein
VVAVGAASNRRSYRDTELKQVHDQAARDGRLTHPTLRRATRSLPKNFLEGVRLFSSSSRMPPTQQTIAQMGQAKADQRKT